LGYKHLHDVALTSFEVMVNVRGSGGKRSAKYKRMGEGSSEVRFGKAGALRKREGVGRTATFRGQ